MSQFWQIEDHWQTLIAAAFAQFWPIVDHWQTLIAGVLAFIAGAAAYRAGLKQARATTQASDAQIALTWSKDRMQARGIAIALYSDILELKSNIQDKKSRLAEVKASYSGKLFGQHVAAIVQVGATVKIPDMISRYLDHLFMLGEVAGPSCLELVSLLFQYNAILDEATSLMMSMNATEWAAQGMSRLETHLASLERLVSKCETELARIQSIG